MVGPINGGGRSRPAVPRSVRLSHWRFPIPSSWSWPSQARRCPGSDALGPARLGAIPSAGGHRPCSRRRRTNAVHAHRAGRRPIRPLPTVVSPNANGICSSGSTGLPKVISHSRRARGRRSRRFLSWPWDSTPQPQTILVPVLRCITPTASTDDLVRGDRLVVLKIRCCNRRGRVERHSITNFTATPT